MVSFVNVGSDWGEWVPEDQAFDALSSKTAQSALYMDEDGTTRPARIGARDDSVTIQKVGKTKASNRLDGKVWEERPTVGS
jgi:hypothetical protein